MNKKRPRYFETPEETEKPLGWWRMVIIIISSHLGVRPRELREEDFRRANGLHIFIAAIVYFVCVLVLLVFLVNYISR
jgi:hypothetical protein